MLVKILVSAWPFAAVLLLSLAVLVRLVRLHPTYPRRNSLRSLHADQAGAVQSLSFVMTVPVFLLFLMLMIQVSQLVIGVVTVEYAAFSAARSAAVWIPARVDALDERENLIGYLAPNGEVEYAGQTYAAYQVEGDTTKLDRIRLAAAIACMPACPSHQITRGDGHPGMNALPSLESAYLAMAPSEGENPRVPDRLRNKLAYALENTEVQLQVFHKESEPPLYTYLIGPYRDEFAANEIGWQDQIQVTVRHRFALLPGPARLLAESWNAESSGDTRRRVYQYPLSATARMNNEGQKPVFAYQQASPVSTTVAPEPILPPDYDDSRDSDYQDQLLP